jgi:ABC-type transporter Mla maintaining outer membrane lipid asymmetry ATPase subunit MlaF
MDTEKVLQISHLEKSFGTHEVLRDIDFTVNKGEAISIIGPSGNLRCCDVSTCWKRRQAAIFTTTEKISRMQK